MTSSLIIPRTISYLLCIFLSAWASESATAQRTAIGITSSRAGEKVTLKVDPIPTGKVELHTTIVDPAGRRTVLPPISGVVSPSSHTILGPVLPAEARGYFVQVELRDPTTGNKISCTGTWVT